MLIVAFSEGEAKTQQRCRGWISHASVAPIFSPQIPKMLILKGFGTSGRQIGAPQPRAPILGPLTFSFNKGFLQSEVLGEVCVLGGGSFG